MQFYGNYNAHLIIVLISMGFLIVVIIYINMQRKCWNGKVYTKSTLTQNPGARKPVHAGTDTSQNSKSRSATADRLLLFCDVPVPACTGFLAPGFCVEVDIAHTFPLQYSRCIFMYIKTTIKKPMDIKTIIKWAL